MNKAFVREPEDTGERYCPKCQSLGQAVARVTVAAHIPAEALAQISEAAYFCPFPQCPVAYFDEYERTIDVQRLLRPLYPKDPEAPLCACFGLTRDDIEEDLLEGGVRRVRETLEKSKTPAAQCLTKAANGRSCAADVQRYYFQRRQQQ